MSAVAAGDVAWIVAVPCAVVVFAAMLLLGPPLGRLLDHGAPTDFWPAIVLNSGVQPEQAEQGRYVVSLALPLLVSALVLLSLRRTPALRPGATRLLARTTQLLAGVFVLVFLTVIAHLPNKFGSFWAPRAYFTWPTIAVAVALAVGILVLAAPRHRRRVTALLRETPARRAAALVIAAAVIVCWLLTAVNSDSSVGRATQTFEEFPQSFEMAWAALSGAGPLVGIDSLYSHLVPYVAAGSMKLFGATMTVYSVTMVSLTGIGMLAMFAMFRRIARSSIGGLLLFLPFLATSFFMIKGELVDRLSLASLFASFPERFVGPSVIAWLTARHLDRAQPRRTLLLFLPAGIVLVNDLEIGLAAFGGAFAALLWTQESYTLRGVARLAGTAALGLVGALAGVTLLTLLVSGTIPHYGWILTYVRIYGSAGWALWPMPYLGVFLVVYMTFVAAVIVGTVRAAQRNADVLLTGMLAFSGIFGLGTFAYYVGQSHPENLIAIFPGWALAVGLLTVAVLRARSTHAGRLPTLPQFAVLFMFGLFACSLAQVPLPWKQVQRIGLTTPTPIFTHNSIERFMAADTRRGDAVLLLNRLPHRLAYDLGLNDVVQYPSGLAVMPLISMLDDSLRRLHAAHGHVVFAWTGDLLDEVMQTLNEAGFVVTRHFDDPFIQGGAPGTYLELRDDVGARSR